MFTQQQESIIDLLKRESSLSLADISSSLKLNKSSISFQLEKLLEEKIIRKKEISAKKIYYSLESKEVLENYIESKKFDLENVLMKNSIVGLDAYIDMLNLIAAGSGEIWGYGNLERKLIPELYEAVEIYRDTISVKKRRDIFTVTDTKENIALLKDHSRKKLWEPWFIGRIATKDIINVNCDIYWWNDRVGICSFEKGGFKVNIYEDLATTQMFKALLKRLFDTSMTKVEYLELNK
ncbi:MAG: ArsR family transcriptional regulator [Candidatus Dojkabacteria bacterium]|nr:ArsR family transcriptional regulator [Candidatus Dojkabacteria bacterium]MDQ7020628.1 ArsR family transcriptional regulator [Candidatus Dojkabacteria bacterium]